MLIMCINYKLMPIPTEEFKKEVPNYFLKDCPSCGQKMWSSPRKEKILEDYVNARLACTYCCALESIKVPDSDVGFMGIDEIH